MSDASIWNGATGSTPVVNVGGAISVGGTTVVDGQTVVNVPTFNYVPNTSSIFVYLNGVLQRSGIDYTETSSSSVTFDTPLDAGDVVYFVGYAIDNVTQVTATYVAEGIGAVIRQMQDKARDIVSVMDYLVQTDVGVVDNTAGIQAALDAAAILQPLGGAVYFPHATKYLITQLVIPTNIILLGNGSFLQQIPDAGVPGLLLDSVEYVYIRDLWVDRDTSGGGVFDGISIVGSCDNVNIESVSVSNYGKNGIAIDPAGGANNINIRKCNSLSNGLNGIEVRNSPNLVRLSENNCTGNGQDGITVYNYIEGILIENNFCNNNGGKGISIYREAITNHSDGVRIVGNNCDFNVEGIYADSLSASTIFGNRCNSCSENGMNLVGVENSLIGANECISNGQNGISVGKLDVGFASFQNRVSDNICKLNGWDGVFLFTTSNMEVGGNYLIDNGRLNDSNPDPLTYVHDSGLHICLSDHVNAHNNFMFYGGDVTQKYAVRFTNGDGNNVLRDNFLDGYVAPVFGDPDLLILFGTGNTNWKKPATAIVFLNGWVNANVAYEVPSYYIDSDGFVNLTGTIKDGSGANITQLPAGFRPALQVGPIVVGKEAGGGGVDFSGVYVTSAGFVSIDPASIGGVVNLNTVRFKVA